MRLSPARGRDAFTRQRLASAANVVRRERPPSSGDRSVASRRPLLPSPVPKEAFSWPTRGAVVVATKRVRHRLDGYRALHVRMGVTPDPGGPRRGRTALGA